MIKSIAFVSPLVLYFVCVGVFDPYSYFDGSPDRHEYAYRMNGPMYELIRFSKNPEQNLLLGDSRMAQIDVGEIQRLTGEEYFNLAFGGATLHEMLAAFWYAEKVSRELGKPLRKVVFGINFSRFQDLDVPDRVTPTLHTLKNPLLYFVSRDVFAAMVFPLFQNLAKQNLAKIGEPQMSREEFWAYQLGPVTRELFQFFRPHDKRLSELRAVVQHALLHGIHIRFVIFPTHVDLQNLIDNEFGLKKQRTEFIETLSTLAPTLNLDIVSELTQSKDSFSDPYHLEPNRMKDLVRTIWASDF